MDDRDFVYWLYGILEFGSFDTLKGDIIDQIMENILEVYDSIQRNGIFNDFDSFRIISFIEGALMYYEDASIEHKVKVTTLIKNEITEHYHRFRDSDDTHPFAKAKQLTGGDFHLEIIPLDMIDPEKAQELLKNGGIHKSNISHKEASSIVSNLLKNITKEKEEYIKNDSLMAEGKEDTLTIDDLETSIKDYKRNEKKEAIMKEVEDMSFLAQMDDSPHSTMNSLDSIASKISVR